MYRVGGKRPLGRRISFVPVAWVSVASIGLAGCESLRLHDEGRLKAAQSAASAAAELTEQGGTVFGPMEENLDSVKATQDQLRTLANQQEYETFKVIVAGLTADE